jgi:TM2 domain-containing membrane protein YozV
MAKLTSPRERAEPQIVTSVEQRAIAESKSLRTAYLLWLVLGVFGGHRLYLGWTVTGVIMLMLALLGLLTLPIGVGTTILAASIVWELIDGVFVKRLVAEQHDEVRERLMAEAEA